METKFVDPSELAPPGALEDRSSSMRANDEEPASELMPPGHPEASWEKVYQSWVLLRCQPEHLTPLPNSLTQFADDWNRCQSVRQFDTLVTPTLSAVPAMKTKRADSLFQMLDQSIEAIHGHFRKVSQQVELNLPENLPADAKAMGLHWRNWLETLGLIPGVTPPTNTASLSSPTPVLPPSLPKVTDWKSVQRAFDWLCKARSQDNLSLLRAAQQFAVVWRKWLGPHSLAIPPVPSTSVKAMRGGADRRAFGLLEGRLIAIKWGVEFARESAPQDKATNYADLRIQCTGAIAVWQDWLILVGLALDAPPQELPLAGTSPIISPEVERGAVLATREKRLWEQLWSYDWTHGGLTSFIRRREGAGAFESRLASILRERGELGLSTEALHAAQIYQSRAALARGDRAIRLTLLRLWVQTVCEQHHWPLPTFEPTKPPPASGEPTGSGSSDGTQGQPGTVFVIELDSPAGTTPEGAPDTTSTSVPETLEATECEAPEVQAVAPTALEPEAPAAAIEPQVLPAPTPSTAKQPPFGCGVRQARVVIQWFPVVVAGMAVIMTGCQHVPAVPDVTPPAVQLPPSSLELIEQPFLAFDCERLAHECPPPTVSRHITAKMVKFCQSEGVSIIHCDW